MDISEVKAKLVGIESYEEFHSYEMVEMLEAAIDAHDDLENYVKKLVEAGKLLASGGDYLITNGLMADNGPFAEAVNAMIDAIRNEK